MKLRLKKRFVTILVIAVFVIIGFLWAREQYVVPIITYHKVDGNAGISKLSISPESFRREISFLKKHNYNVVKLEAMAELVKSGKFPPKTIAITFDDGYENNYINAYPILKEYKIPATIFIVPNFIGKDGYLTWDQVIEMSNSGVISIGNHTMSHGYLPSFQGEKLNTEITDSKKIIEDRIKKEVLSFSYPLGGFNDLVRDKVIESGYKIAAAVNPGKNYPKHDLFAMKRVRISRTSDNLLVFWIEISGFYTWIKEHRDDD